MSEELTNSQINNTKRSAELWSKEHGDAFFVSAEFLGRVCAEALALRAELSRKDAEIAVLKEALSNIVSNARIQPDADMNGVTDCYAVPLDDIAEARAKLAKVRGEG